MSHLNPLLSLTRIACDGFQRVGDPVFLQLESLWLCHLVGAPFAS